MLVIFWCVYLFEILPAGQTNMMSKIQLKRMEARNQGRKSFILCGMFCPLSHCGHNNVHGELRVEANRGPGIVRRRRRRQKEKLLLWNGPHQPQM